MMVFRTLLQLGASFVALATVFTLWWPLRGTWSRGDLNLWRVIGYLSLITAAALAIMGIFDHWAWFVPAFILLFCVFLANEGLQAAKAQRRWALDPNAVVQEPSQS